MRTQKTQKQVLAQFSEKSGGEKKGETLVDTLESIDVVEESLIILSSIKSL